MAAKFLLYQKFFIFNDNKIILSCYLVNRTFLDSQEVGIGDKVYILLKCL